jgi:acyl carrier protein
MQRLLEEGPSYDQVVHLWNLDTSSDLNDAIALGTSSALHLTQTVLRHSPEARLWFVTRGAQPVEPGPLSVEQSPVHGLALVIAQEYPQLQCTCVDLGGHETGAAELCQELLSGSTELRVAWRGNTRYAARIEHTSIPNVNVPELRDDSTYLITGGLGSLGLQTAKYLIQEGARHLLLTGRGGIAGKESKVAELEALGASVMVVQADIADPDDVRRMLATPMPPLRGVIHAAGVLDDGMAAQQSLERLSRVLAPKVHGAWNLHESTKDLPLDFFICFSSAASLVGSPGQCTYAAGNAFLDSLAHHRTSLGLPGLSINWGAWGEGGMAADAQIRHRMAARGVSEIEPAQGFALLSRILNPNPGVARFGVLPVDWTKFLSQFSGAIPSLFKSLAESSGSAPVAVSLKLENMTGRDERERILGDHVRQLLASVLGIDSPLHVPLRQRFFEMGMDSLTAVQLKNRLEATLCVKLPATLAFDHPTLEALTAHLGPLVLGPPEEHGATPDTDDNAELDGLSVEQLAALLTEELEEGAVNVR